MHRVVEGAHLDHDVDESAQAGRQGWGPHGPVGGVRDDDEVCLQGIAMRLDEGAEGRRSGLLLAFDEDGDAQTLRGQLLAHETERGHMGHHPSLVVGGAAAVEPPPALDRLEGRTGPVGGIAGGLHIVVGIEEHGGAALGRRGATDDGGSTVSDGFDGHLGHAGVTEQRGDGFGAATHGFAVVALEGDGGDAHEILQIIDRVRQQGLEPRAKDLPRVVVGRGGRVRGSVRGAHIPHGTAGTSALRARRSMSRRTYRGIPACIA